MKKLLIVAAFLLGAVGCCSIERKAVSEVEATQDIILPQYLNYVEKDAVLSPAQKDDRKKLVESLRRVTGNLKKTTE